MEDVRQRKKAWKGGRCQAGEESMERWNRCTARGEGMEKMVDVRLRETAWRN